MDVSPEHLVEQARERFQLQDYYGAIHLLEEVLGTGRAFADAHHLLGLSYSLVGQSEQALTQLDRALTLNPQYVEALVHRAIVLNELGRGRPTSTPRRCSGSRATSPATGSRRRTCGRRAASGARKILEWRRISRCSPGTTSPSKSLPR